MSFRIIPMYAFLLIVTILFLSCKSENDLTISDTIIAIEKTALNRWGKGDVYGYLDIYAEEITYFDTGTEHRLDGLPVLKQRYEPLQGDIHIGHYHMIDPTVQVHGNTAVLTYNLIDFVPDEQGGFQEIRWNSTAVYARIGTEWKIIHSHWAHTRPHDQDIDPDQPM